MQYWIHGRDSGNDPNLIPDLVCVAAVYSKRVAAEYPEWVIIYLNMNRPKNDHLQHSQLTLYNPLSPIRKLTIDPRSLFPDFEKRDNL